MSRRRGWAGHHGGGERRHGRAVGTGCGRGRVSGACMCSMHRSIETVGEQGLTQASCIAVQQEAAKPLSYTGVLPCGGGGAPDGEGCCCGAGCALLDGQLRAAEGCKGSGEGRRRLSALLGRPGRRARGPHQPPAQCAAPMAPTWPGLHAAEGGGHGGLLLLGAGLSVLARRQERQAAVQSTTKRAAERMGGAGGRR